MVGMGWDCGRCSFRHHAPGTRCVMCNELRVSKEQMRDFILGKAIPASHTANSSTVSVASRGTSIAAATTTDPPSPFSTNAGNSKRPRSNNCASSTGTSGSTTTTRCTSLSQQLVSEAFAPSNKNSASTAAAAAVAATRPPRCALEPNVTGAVPVLLPPLRNPYARPSSSSGATLLPRPTSSSASAAPPPPPQHRTIHATSNHPSASFAGAEQPQRPSSTALVLSPSKLQIGSMAHQSSAVVNDASMRTTTTTTAASLNHAISHRRSNSNADVSLSLGHTSQQQQQQRASYSSHVAASNPNSLSSRTSSFAPQQNGVKNHGWTTADGTNSTALPNHSWTAQVSEQASKFATSSSSIPVSNNAANSKNKTPFTIAASAGENRKRPRSQQHHPMPLLQRLPYQPGPVPLAMENASTWIYPSADDYPKRQYQLEMAKSAILQNTLVSLPTGLGKTLIAAVVLYNYYRWFPTGKIIFLAPTLPLVDQQVKACYEIMGIPATDTALLTGKVPAPQRAVIWREKRVFFCTPQTVQKDLENNRCDAVQVVCVVLDEAHKATGDYAYCKVIAHLEQAGAKFRILGLSATPGTSIKAIQQVVDVLHINCIEARSDADPDVKQYIHDRQTEVVVVKAATATKQVERILDAIIAPILEGLRRRNVLPARLTGNATITPYCIVSAREHFNKRPEHERDSSALGYFSAAVRFVQIRSDLHKLGIGSVRGKIHQMQHERPRGYLATIVKSKEFQSLWDEVEKVSCDPNAVGNTVEDKLKNNPKLEKLREILTEHFERAKACGTSSRAIVFSQFRNSVSEIVNVLNESKPLIRARQFVGQGKGGAKSEKEGEKQVEGMKQNEQKAVLEQFKGGVHNALVCTSIGEEGLDIGEVDLIVNFDCLSSPIRMIQRVGRTGRKRDGRVVTLVAEGSEEKTLAKSRQNERNLVHALKNPKSFIVVPNAPMFPTEPVIRESNMTISQNFHMSQVHGARRKLKIRLSSGGLQRKQLGAAGNWKLTETEGVRRSNVLDHLKDLRIEDSGDVLSAFPAQLRRRLLAGRAISISRNKKNDHRLPVLGRTVQLLRKIEASHSTNPNDPSPPVKAGRSRKLGESVLDLLFPLTISDCTTREDSLVSYECAAVPTDMLKVSAHVKDPVAALIPAPEPLNTGGAIESLLNTTSEIDLPSDSGLPIGASVVMKNNVSTQAQPSFLPCNPYSARPKGDPTRSSGLSQGRAPTSTSKVADATFCGALDQNSAQLLDRSGCPDPSLTVATLPPKDREEHQQRSAYFMLPTDSSNLDKTAKLLVKPREEIQQDFGQDWLEADEFRLPSQDDSSSDSSAGEDAAAPMLEDASEDLFRLPTQSSDEENDDEQEDEAIPAKVEEDAFDDAFRLPTPESSSDEEEGNIDEADGAERDDRSEDATPLASRTSNDLAIAMADESVSALPFDARAALPNKTSQESFLQNTQRSVGRVRFSLDNSSFGDTMVLADTPESEIHRKKKKAIKRIRAIEDTPDSKADSSMAVPRAAGSRLDYDLTNTQDERGEDVCCENLVCAVCLGNDLSEGNPIILCDGPGSGVLCNLPVHVSCYSQAKLDLSDGKEWRCDRCEFLHGDGQSGTFECCLCHRSDGALKRSVQGEWKHVTCRPSTEGVRLKRLRRQQNTPASTKDPAGAARRPLADLSPNDEPPDAAEMRTKRRRQIMQQFIDDEADASDDDLAGDREEDEDALAIEEEEQEFAKGFINDSTQLGYTQDELDQADPAARAEETTHRALDVERERKRQFATPLLNRRMQERQAASDSSHWSDTPASAPNSTRGLGNMHFIRSVLEHHRQGGRAEDIEEFYRDLEGEESDNNEPDPESEW